MKIMVMSRRGHEVLAQWDQETTEEELCRIDQEFNQLLSRGYSAFAVTSGERLDKFQPELKEDIFLVAPVAGGCRAD